VRIRVILSHLTGFGKIINRALKLLDLTVANSALYVCLELLAVFQEFQCLSELSYGFYCRRVLHFSVDQAKIEKGFTVCAVAELQNFFEAFDGFL